MSEIAAKTPHIADGLVKYLAIGVSFAAAFAAGLTYASGLPTHTAQNGALIVGLVTIGLFVSTFVHEAGHALGAMLAGWRIIVFAVQPFAIHLPNKEFTLPGKRQFGGRLGYVAAAPASPETLSIGRWMIFIGGGPAASLFFAAYLWIMAQMLAAAATPSSVTRLLAAICTGFALQSMSSCITTLLPRQRPGLASDGWKLLRGLTGGKTMPERHAQPWLLALMKYRIRPRDLPQWMLDDIGQQAASSAPLRHFLAMLEIARLLDAKRPDYALVRQKIEAFRYKFGADDWLCGCDAYVAVFHEDDLDRATQALAVPHAKIRVPELTFAAKAALSARQGNEANAWRHLASMDAALYQASPFRSDCYADIRRNIEMKLRNTIAELPRSRL